MDAFGGAELFDMAEALDLWGPEPKRPVKAPAKPEPAPPQEQERDQEGSST